jgi:excisionase family DNA binding protein
MSSSAEAHTLLKAAQAGRLLGLSARTMYALAAAGKIACHRMGVGDAAVRFDPADLEAYKQSCRSPATTPAAGCSSLTASLPESASALTAFFRKAGREPKPKRTTSENQRASGTLRLVEKSQSA